METHRPGPLKQQNKAHKTGQHKTKGQLKKEIKGRVNVKSLSKKKKQQLGKIQRRNQSNQVRKNKRDEVLNKKRSKGGGIGCPLLTAVIPLNSSLDCANVLNNLKSCDEALTVKANELGLTHISVPRFKQRLSFIIPPYGKLYDMLDITKVADSVLLLVNSEGVDEYGEYCLSCLFAQGCPSIVLGYQSDQELSQKKQNEAKKAVLKQLNKRFSDDKLHNIDSSQDCMLMLRFLGQQKLQELKIREQRPHMIAEDISFELANQQSDKGTLKVSGYVRGQTLSVNGLVHLPGWGDFQMSQIDAPSDPYPFVAEREARSRKNSLVEMNEMETGSDLSVRVLEIADPLKQQSLQCEVVPDPMEGEQTWPTDEELAEAEERQKKSVKRVPKGMSEYQASWIVDDTGAEVEAEDYYSDEEGEDDAMEECDVSDEASDGDSCEDEEEEEYENLELQENDEGKYDATIDLNEEQEMLNKYKEERQHVMFPDEVDTPRNSDAKTRFQRYRGLKSFRTSPWDPKENLPQDYARIFQFENFQRTKKNVLREMEDNQGALAGWYVTVHVKDVPKEFMESYTPGKPFILFGILAHEQKMSVCNILLHCNNSQKQPIKSKEAMIFHVGYRRFSAGPIYSQHTNGDKHKFEKFLPKEGVVIATIYAPVMFPPAAVMMFKARNDGQHELIATGSVLSVNPNRIIAKRVVLSGHPFKINQKTATVRYMFFNRDDILWFKPVELRTKWGRRGHIKECLGTHGHMKCVFDGQLKSQDTVLMNLYKRVYPKWNYSAHINDPPTSTEVPESGMAFMDDDADVSD